MILKRLQDRDGSVRQFVRFCLVGGFVTLLHYVIYWGLIHILWPENEIWINTAYIIGYVMALCCNLLLTSKFTFRQSLNIKKTGGFIVSHLVNCGIHIALLNIFLWVGLSSQWAPIPVFCIAIPINFLMVRYVFSSKLFKDQESI